MYIDLIINIYIRGLHVAQSCRCGQCESLEKWERVTDSHVFLFTDTAIGESADKKMAMNKPILDVMADKAQQFFSRHLLKSQNRATAMHLTLGSLFTIQTSFIN